MSAAPTSKPPFEPPTIAIFLALVYLSDQSLGSSDEIIKHVLLVFFHSRLMPFPTVFSAASQIWEGEDTTLFDPARIGRGKRWSNGNVKPTVTG